MASHGFSRAVGISASGLLLTTLSGRLCRPITIHAASNASSSGYGNGFLGGVYSMARRGCGANGLRTFLGVK